MKRNKFFMLGIVTVLVAVLSLTFVSNTFAKYTSTVTGSDSARVAKWEWEFKGDDITLSTSTPIEVNFNLFDNVYDTDGSDETDVKEGASETIIAPGTKGYFEFNLTNASEVSANVDFSFEADKQGVPLQFSINGTDWFDNITELNDDHDQNVKFGEDTTTLRVYWQWVFNGNDTTDTDLGIAGTAEPTVTMTVLLTQID